MPRFEVEYTRSINSTGKGEIEADSLNDAIKMPIPDTVNMEWIGTHIDVKAKEIPKDRFMVKVDISKRGVNFIAVEAYTEDEASTKALKEARETNIYYPVETNYSVNNIRKLI